MKVKTKVKAGPRGCGGGGSVPAPQLPADIV
jgi:hypothetical protein